MLIESTLFDRLSKEYEKVEYDDYKVSSHDFNNALNSIAPHNCCIQVELLVAWDEITNSGISTLFEKPCHSL